MKTSLFLCVLFTFSVTPALAQKKVAVVKLLRGEASILISGKTEKLKAEDWVAEGAVIKTEEKSFVKLVFIDKSQMNIGPGSEMKIENFSGKDSGMIDLVKGKIRSQVTKDYLQMEDKNKSKLFIKTANAVMGVRGTDFMISSNGKTSSVVLFEGEVVFNKLDARGVSSSRALEEIVDKGVRMVPGEFSVVEQRQAPTVPSLLNVQQRETLERNDSFEADRGPSNSGKNEAAKSVVPAGLSGDVVANSSDVIKKEVVDMVVPQAPASSRSSDAASASKDPGGFLEGDKVKPANGSFLHVESGVIIPPAPDSVLDKNSNTYIAGSGNGSVGKNGDYIPPKNVEITNDGKIMVSVKDERGGVTVKEVPKPVPVVRAGASAMTNLGNVRPPPPIIQPSPIAGTPLPPPGGNLPAADMRIQNQMENKKLSPTTNTTIRVNTGN